MSALPFADTGIGMDENTLARAIEPFYTTKGVGKGTGLGLPMVHGMAEQSGSKLVLKSAPGESTTAEAVSSRRRRGDRGKVSETPQRSRPAFARGLKLLVSTTIPWGHSTQAQC
jgi:light-regulated signal transduction histidine kinase (bacteriophytochrome)